MIHTRIIIQLELTSQCPTLSRVFTVLQERKHDTLVNQSLGHIWHTAKLPWDGYLIEKIALFGSVVPARGEVQSKRPMTSTWQLDGGSPVLLTVTARVGRIKRTF